MLPEWEDGTEESCRILICSLELFRESKGCLLVKTKLVDDASGHPLLILLVPLSLLLGSRSAPELSLILLAPGLEKSSLVCMVCVIAVVRDISSAQSAPVCDDWALG